MKIRNSISFGSNSSYFGLFHNYKTKKLVNELMIKKSSLTFRIFSKELGTVLRLGATYFCQ